VEKQNYQGVFNWHGEIITFYRHAASKAEAEPLIFRALAKKVGYTTKFVRDCAYSHGNSFEIKEVKE
jgi:hypothetical protein